MNIFTGTVISWKVSGNIFEIALWFPQSLCDVTKDWDFSVLSAPINVNWGCGQVIVKESQDSLVFFGLQVLLSILWVHPLSLTKTQSEVACSARVSRYSGFLQKSKEPLVCSVSHRAYGTTNPVAVCLGYMDCPFRNLYSQHDLMLILFVFD